MNLMKLSRTYSDRKYTPETVLAAATAQDKAAILHEFGHALGLLHEHQNPNLDCQSEIKWSGPNNVFDYYEAKYDWTQAEVKRNIGFIALSDPDYVASHKDLDSIMMYPLPPQIFKNPNSPCIVSAPFSCQRWIKKLSPPFIHPSPLNTSPIILSSSRPPYAQSLQQQCLQKTGQD